MVADLTLRGMGGQPAAHTPLRLYAEVDGQVPLNLYTTTDDAGTYQLRFTLPQVAALRARNWRLRSATRLASSSRNRSPSARTTRSARILSPTLRDAQRPAPSDPSCIALETETAVVAPISRWRWRCARLRPIVPWRSSPPRITWWSGSPWCRVRASRPRGRRAESAAWPYRSSTKPRACCG